MMGLRWMALAAVLVGGACSKTTAPAPVPSAPSADAGSSAKPQIPPFDDACTTDADCAATHIHTSGSELCCSLGCGIGKGSKTWVDAVEAACKRSPHPECKDIQCDGPSPPFKPKCERGHCTLTY